MSEDHDPQVRDRWPRFELVNFSVPTGIPNGWDDELLRKGVPKSLFRRYEATRELMLLEDSRYDPLVCFGTSGPFVKICFDPSTKQIVDVVYDSKANTQEVGVHATSRVIRTPLLVNTTLDQFINSVRAVLDRFPFDQSNSGTYSVVDKPASGSDQEDKREREWDRAVEDLAETLSRIDPAAVANPDGFWRTLLDDIQMGDFATEEVLKLP